MSKKSDEYDRQHPGVNISENQKEERMDRRESQRKKQEGQTRFFTVPDVPWKKKEGEQE